MSIFVVIPVKMLSKSKMRLSALLNASERALLTLAMLKDVLKAVKRSIASQIVVITSDPIVQRFSREFGALTIHEKREGLNEAIDQATEWCIKRSTSSVLILPADIPLITSEDINKIINLSEVGSIVISPSIDNGTNALMRSPPNVIRTYFGPRSFQRHFDEALKRGIEVKVYRSPRVSLDIDSIENLETLFRIGAETEAHRFLKSIKFDERSNRPICSFLDLL
jgi:2-phospho-L-lactate guanylyltransferase